MLNVSVRPRNDLSFIIEQENIEPADDMSIYSYLSAISNNDEPGNNYITVLLDNEIIKYEDWKNTSLKNHTKLIFIVEPAGTAVMIGIMLIAMAASFVYFMIQLNKMRSQTGTDTSSESRSIYDVNVQGNKVKLGDVIPEQFGTFKKFPDYLSDPHIYYIDNEFYLDVILSQGIGHFQYSSDGSDIYIGATPIRELTGISYHIAEPGEDLSNNTIDPEITKCWYSSTEVTSTGHTIHCIDSTDTVTTHLEYESIWFENYDEQQEKYEVGDILQISGVSDEWVLLPAFQDVNDGYPQLMACSAQKRIGTNYECPFPHVHQYQITPFTAEARRPHSSSDTGYTANLWTEPDYIAYVGSTSLSGLDLIVWLGEFSYAGCWSRFGNELGWAVSNGVPASGWNYQIGNTGTYSRISGLAWNHYVNITEIERGKARYSTTAGDNQKIYTYDGLNAISWAYEIWDPLYLGGWLQTYRYDTDYYVEKLIYGEYVPFHRRLQKSHEFDIEIVPAVRYKCLRCDANKDLEGKYIDFVGNDIYGDYYGRSSTSFNTHKYNNCHISAISHYSYGTLGQGDNVSTHFVFDLLETIRRDYPELEDITTEDQPARVGWGVDYPTLESAYEIYTSGITLLYDDTDSFKIDENDGIPCYAVRITAKAEKAWNLYDAQNGIIDDNGYYKIVDVYGGESGAMSTTHQTKSAPLASECVTGHSWIGIRNGVVGDIPNIRKFKVVRCDKFGNELSGWDGFWNCLSQSKSTIVKNITKNISTSDNLIAGPYRASPIGVDTSEIEIDLSAPAGIYYMTDSGKIKKHTVKVRIEYQRKGDVGWQSREVELSSSGIKHITSYNPPKYTSTGKDPVAHTEKFNLSAGDWYFRIYRITPEHKGSNNYYDEVKWTGLKSVIANPQHYNAMTVMLMRFVGNETLSELSDNQISTIWTRKLPNIETGVLEPTSNLAPAVKYICDNSKFADLIDIENLSEMDAIWNVRGLSLNGTVDTDNTLLQVLDDILHIGYSELSVRANYIRLVQVSEHTRNQLAYYGYNRYGVTDISYLFTPANYSSISIDVSLPKKEDAEEIVVEYTDIQTYKTATVYLHIDCSVGNSNGKLVITDYPTSIYQEKLHTFGVTDREQAIAMGARRLRTLKRQRIKITIKTDIEGLNVYYKDLVGIALDTNDWNLFSSEESNNVNTDYVISGNNAGNDRVSVDTRTVSGYSGRIIKCTAGNNYYDLKIYPSFADWNSNVKRFGSCFITDIEGVPHYTVISQWRNTNTIRVSSLPFEWNNGYGSELEYPRISSVQIVPCWIESVKPTEKDCTIEMTNYDPTVFRDDLPIREGYGVSAYGSSSYGVSY